MGTTVSVGYQEREPEQLLAQLHALRVDLVVDVRLNASSRRRGFGKTALRTALSDAGIDYLHLRELGNPREGRAAFARDDPTDGYAAYRHRLAEPAAHRALETLRQLAAGSTVALLCFEADERHCHRAVLLAELA